MKGCPSLREKCLQFSRVLTQKLPEKVGILSQKKCLLEQSRSFRVLLPISTIFRFQDGNSEIPTLPAVHVLAAADLRGHWEVAVQPGAQAAARRGLYQPINKSMSQSTNQSINKSINQMWSAN